MSTLKRPIVWLGLLAAFHLTFSWLYLDLSVPNERSRLYLAVDMVDHGTLAIDQAVDRFGSIPDLAAHDGHTYSDKAPGSSFLAAGVYWAVRQFSAPSDWTIQGLLRLMRTVLAIPIGLIGFFLLWRYLRHIDVAAWVAELTAVGWILGTTAFHYSTVYYGHQIVAVALLGALWLVEIVPRGDLAADEEGALGDYLKMAGAGALAGVAGLTEYQAGIPCVLLALYVAATHLRRDWGLVAAFAFGAAPFLLVLGAYNTAAFGGPLELSYQHLAKADLQEIHEKGLGGITYPTWEAFAGSMFSFHRGLFVTSPLFVFALPGIWFLWQKRRGLAMLLASVCAFYVWFISSSSMWVAGWSFGPRLIVPGMTFGALLAGVGADALREYGGGEVLFRGAVVFGLLYNQTIAAIFPEPPPRAANPLLDFVVPLWRENLFVPNLAHEYLGLPPRTSLAVLAVGVLAIGLFVLVRGLARLPVGRRIATTVAALAVPVAVVGGMIAKGPAWDKKKRQDFVKHVRHMGDHMEKKQ